MSAIQKCREFEEISQIYIGNCEMSLLVLLYVPTVSGICCGAMQQSSTCSIFGKKLHADTRFLFRHTVHFFTHSLLVYILCVLCLPVARTCCTSLQFTKCELRNVISISDSVFFLSLSHLDFVESKKPNVHIARLHCQLCSCWLHFSFAFFIMLMLKISQNHIAPHHIILFKYHLVRFGFF